METEAISLLALMRSNSVAPGIITAGLNQLKADVKHKNVPHAAAVPIFEVIRLALDSTGHLDAGLSTLSHLTKRLKQQRQLPLLESQARRTIPQVFELLSHEKERLRTRATQALSEFCAISPDISIHIGIQLHQRGVSEAITDDIMYQAGSTAPKGNIDSRSTDTKPPAAAARPVPKSEELSHTLAAPHNGGTEEASVITPSIPSKPAQDPVVAPLPYSPEPSAAELEAAKLDPIYVESARDVEHLFAEMLPFFDGKETEQNWTRREQSALKIRKITRGNAPEDFLQQYTAGVKQMLDGLVKGCTSLRTTVSTLSCHCVQDIARQLRQGLDPMVEVLFQCLLKLCAATKKLTAASGNACVAELVSCVTFTARLGQHLLNATKDKNIQPRHYATKWIMIVLTRYGRQRSHLDPHLDTLSTAIANGLNDRDKDVREAMRPTFWAFARLWNDKSKNLLSKMDKKQQELLLSDGANPFPKEWFSVTPSIVNIPTKGTLATKPSIKDAIAQQRASKKAPLDRPGSAADIATPAKEVSARIPARPKSSLMTTRRPALASSTGTMSSAPVRPLRPAQKSGPARIVPSETPSARRARTLEEASKPPKTPRSFVEAPPSTAVESTSVDRPAETSTQAPFAATVEDTPGSQPAETYSQESSAPTVESTFREEPNAPAPEARKRVSPSEEDEPLQFHKNRPPKETGFVSIEKPPTVLADTTIRVPVDGQTADSFGQPTTIPGILGTNRTGCEMIPCQPDTPAPLPVEPSRFPASEASDLPVDGAFSIPPPENATHGPQQNSDYDTSTRLSQSPRAPASRKEAPKSTGESRGGNPLRVYEDDKEPVDQESVDLWLQVAKENPTAASIPTNQVLGELPINTEIHKRSNSFSDKENTAADNAGIYQTRQMIQRAVPRINEGTFDQDGYRKLRHLIYQSNKWAMGEDGRNILDELVLSVLSVLQGISSYAQMSHDQLHPLRAGALHLLQALEIKNKKDLGRWGLRLIRAMVYLRNDYSNNTHVATVLNRLCKQLLAHNEPPTNLNDLMIFMETPSTRLDPAGIAFGYELLTAILQQEHVHLEDFEEQRLGQLVIRGMFDLFTDTRMAAMETAIVMYEVVKPESRYWRLMLELDEEHKMLLNYYLVTQGRSCGTV